jgi:hypothetical protein
MDLSPVKREILEAVLLQEKPARAAQIAKEVGKGFPPVMMHLIGLARMGYTESPEKGYFVITDKGRKVLGLPEITRENAVAILMHLPDDRAFHFYAGLGKPLDLYAHSLQDFCDRIGEVSVESIEFHMKRGDFEAWFTCLGDPELGRKTTMLREKNLAGEELHSRLREMVENRYILLSKKVERAVPSL